MYHLLKNNQKKLLTIFAAALMVVFIIPPAVSHFSGRRDVIEGHIGTQEVTAQAIGNARNEWNLLKGNIRIAIAYQGRPQLVPLAQVLGIDAFEAIDQHRDMYYLLQYEAREMGIQVSVDRLQSLLQQRIYVLDEQQHKSVPYNDIRDPDIRSAVEGTVANFMLVQNAAERISDVMKVSTPMRRRAMATQLQELTLKLADFDAADLAKKVPAPTDKQLQRLFDQYANTAPGAYSADDPLGFGYRYPDRIKLQYIKISWADLRKAARDARNEYDWKVEAYKQYQAHPEKFKIPATKPTTQTSAAASQPASTQPRIEPFEQVFEEIRDNLVDAAAKTMQGKIRTDIEGRLQKDFDSWEAAQATSRPSATDASSSLGVPYDSFQYLQKLADLVQKQYRVRLSVVDLDRYLDAKTLSSLPGLGDAQTIAEQGAVDIGAGPTTTPFAEYALSDAAGLLPNNGKDNPAALLPYKLSLPLSDSQDDVYYFRIPAAQPAHRPDDLSEVRAQVEEDARTEEAYQQVKQKAQALLASAQKQGLEVAAKAAGVKLQTVGPVTAQPGVPIENFPLSAIAHGQFAKESFNLLDERAKSGNAHPMSLIELPTARRVAVAQLENVKAEWTEQTLGAYQSMTGMELAQRLRQPLIAEWFNYDRLVDRVHFVPAPQSS